MVKVRKELSFVEVMKKIRRSGASSNAFTTINNADELDKIETLEKRVDKIFNIINKKRENNMLFFIMYDIQSNKVRAQVVKYLIRNGCCRIQKSIFLASLEQNDFERIKSDLSIVQETYDNEDSILIVPISTDYLYAMKVIGQSIDVDLITKNKNTIFF